jgi:hypothetical protein
MSGFFAGLTGKALAVALVLLAAGGLMIGAATLVYKATANVQAIIDKSVARAEDAARAECHAQIAQSNSEANAKIAAQSRVIVQVQADATEKIAEISRDEAAKRKDNEALPSGGSCGIDAAHSRVLIR